MRKVLVRNLYSFTILGVLVVAFSCNSTELRKGTGRRLQSGPWNHQEGWIKFQKRGRAQAHSLNCSQGGATGSPQRMWPVGLLGLAATGLSQLRPLPVVSGLPWIHGLP